MYSEILRYMGHKGAADVRIKKLIASSLEKLASVSTPRFVKQQFPCIIEKENVNIETLTINSGDLASHLSDSEKVCLFAATLGAEVDRTISQRSIVDSAEALCLQACAAVKIEEYCDNIEKEISIDAEKQNLHITSRFSPGYGDFSIEHQQDILRMLNAQKRIGVTVTKSLMLSPLKTVTAIIGLSKNKTPRTSALKKCINCNKIDCEFRSDKGYCRD